MIVDINNIDEMYKDYRLKKRNGYKKRMPSGRQVWVPAKYREIQAPNKELKTEQKKILKDLYNIKVSDCAFGFVDKKDIYKNAKEHLGAKYILELDLKNFFDTITKEQVYKALINNGVDKEKAEYISIVCTRYGATPQGAPTSPYLSNIVCKPMDKKLKDLCIEYGCKYTRYADDLTFSTDNNDGYEMFQKMKSKIQSIINKSGFKINGNKTHTVGKHRQQNVTGIVVNEKLNVSNKDIMKFRAKLHNILMDIRNNKMHNLDELEKNYDSIDALQGYANFIYNANPKKCEKYVDQVKEIKGKLS